MATKQSIKAAVRDAVSADRRLRRELHTGTQLSAATSDSFVNFAQKLGVGADNALSSATYGYNPITRNRVLLEWIHRGSWLGGVAVDVVADDMTRKGVTFDSEMEPQDAEKVERYAQTMGVWDSMNETIRWSRLYGGAVSVMLIDGQDLKTPLRLETVGTGQFKGLLCLDRWMVDPSLSDLVTEYGPSLGLPKYYTVQSNAPALKGVVIHHSRLALRLEGVQLPYQQRLTENLWGISVLERLYDRMIAFDSASTGAAQLVYKSYLRTLSIEGMREIAGTGGKPLEGLIKYTEIMRRFQGIEGITLIDSKDKFEAQQHGAFSGLDSILRQFGEQVAGALQIPLTRLFGQSPGGLNSTGESDLTTYYDGIHQKQQKAMGHGVQTVYRLCAQSEGVKVPENFCVAFKSLWDMDDTQKVDVASKTTETVVKAKDAGLISDQVALKELRQSSRTTGVFSNITQADIDAADDQTGPPGIDELELDPKTGLPKPALKLPGEDDGQQTAGQNGKEVEVGGGKARRKLV